MGNQHACEAHYGQLSGSPHHSQQRQQQRHHHRGAKRAARAERRAIRHEERCARRGGGCGVGVMVLDATAAAAYGDPFPWHLVAARQKVGMTEVKRICPLRVLWSSADNLLHHLAIRQPMCLLLGRLLLGHFALVARLLGYILLHGRQGVQFQLG